MGGGDLRRRGVGGQAAVGPRVPPHPTPRPHTPTPTPNPSCRSRSKAWLRTLSYFPRYGQEPQPSSSPAQKG